MQRMIVALLFAAACGSSKPAAAPAPAAASPDGSAERHGEMHGEMDMPPALAHFHDVLAPRWHAEPGAPRMKATCDAVTAMLAAADGIAKADPPAGADPAAWKTRAGDLTASINSLQQTCTAGDAAAFEVAFAQVHENFHHLMEAAGMHHDMHEMGSAHAR